MSEIFAALPFAVNVITELLTRKHATRERRQDWLARELEDAFRQAFGGVSPVDYPEGRGRPDILVRRRDTQSDLAVELRVLSWGTVAKNLPNRTSELLSQSVSIRRLLGKDSVLAVILVFADSPSDDADEGSRSRVSALLERSIRELRRDANDGVGFDAVLVGRVDSDESWVYQDQATETFENLELPDAVQRISNLTSAGTFAKTPSGNQYEGGCSKTAKRFLLVCDEWRSGRGGISTVNRELAIALAEAGHETCVVVPETTTPDLEEAATKGVSLVTPVSMPGLSNRELLCTRPVFSDSGFYPDVVIGHGRLLGPYAFALQNQFFPAAKRIHIVHTDAESLESAKENLGGPSNMSKADARRATELALASSADLVLGVGPLLTDSIQHSMRGLGANTPPVRQLLPGLRNWPDVVDPMNPPSLNQVLLLGRMEDMHSKGIDIAAGAVLRAYQRLGGSPLTRPTLVVRGVPEEMADSVKRKLDETLQPYISPLLRPYSNDENTLRFDLWQSRVVLMPSRHEGFGLVAYEAIAAGVPVLMSAESGVARFVASLSGLSEGSEIQPVREDATLVSTAWGDALYERLAYPSAAFERAAALRDEIARVVDWRRTVADLLEWIETLG